MFWTSSVVKLLLELVSINKQMLKILRLRQPGIVFLVVTKENGSMLNFKLVLPAPGAADVVSRQLSFQIANGTTQAHDLSGTTMELDGLSGNDNDTVAGFLTDIDDAGNASPTREFSFVLLDTIAPAQPGEVGLVVTSEE
jgi:hypothetical protein